MIAGANPLLPSTVAHVNKPSPRTVTVSDAELAALMGGAAPWLALLVMLCHDAALRVTAALAFSRLDYFAHTGEIVRRGKAGHVTRLPASGRLRALLTQCPEGDAPFVKLLYNGAHGVQTVSYDMAQVHFRKLVAAVGIERHLSLHDLRRTMAEKVYSATQDMRCVQQLLGHNSLFTTAYYLHKPASPKSRDALLAALDGAHVQ